MTAKEFAELYKGRRVRVNEQASMEHNRGRTGIVAYGSGGVVYLEMEGDDGHEACFKLHKLDLIDEPDNTPLPLPG